jgi:hypothetical protein
LPPFTACQISCKSSHTLCCMQSCCTPSQSRSSSSAHRGHCLAWVLSQLLDCQRHIHHITPAQAHSQCIKQRSITQDVLTLILRMGRQNNIQYAAVATAMYEAHVCSAAGSRLCNQGCCQLLAAAPGWCRTVAEAAATPGRLEEPLLFQQELACAPHLVCRPLLARLSLGLLAHLMPCSRKFQAAECIATA